MTPSIVAAVLLFACPPARSAPPDYSGTLAQARTLYAAHEIGQKTLDQALKLPVPAPGDAQAAQAVTDLQTLFLAARDVQEGCLRPCASPADTAVYREKARLVAAKLGFDAKGMPKVDQRYIPEGKPRLKAAGGGTNAAGQQYEAAAVTLLLSNNSLPPQTREALNQKALALADALGRSQYIQTDGSGVAAIPGGASLRLTPRQIADLNRIPRAQADVLRRLATSPPPSPVVNVSDPAGPRMALMPSHAPYSATSADSGGLLSSHAPTPVLGGSAGQPAVSAKAQACIQTVNGPDPGNPDHPTLAKMCVDNPNWGPVWAPLLAGLLDAVKEQFGTVQGIITNIIFLLLGLLMSVATGGVALVLKLVALIAAGWAIYKLIAGLISAAARADLRQIGFAGGTLLIMVMMALVGFGIGKTKPGANAVRSMESGMAAALDKVGITGLMGKLNSMMPAGMMATLERFLGKAPPERAPGTKPSDVRTAQPAPKATEAPPPVREPPATLRAKVKSRVASLFGSGSAGVTARVAPRLDSARGAVAGEMKTLLTKVMGKSDGEITPAQFNRMYQVLVAYAKRNGIQVTEGGHWMKELLINGRTLGVYPKSPTAIDLVAFGKLKPGEQVSSPLLHELAHMFHAVQMRATLLRGGVTGAESSLYLKLMENGGNYLQLEKAATAIGNPYSRLMTIDPKSGARYLDKISGLVDATDTALASGKVKIPFNWSLEEVYAYTISRLPLLLGKSVSELALVRMPFVYFVYFYASNTDISQVPGLGTTDPERLRRIGLNPGPIGFRDLINAAIMGTEG
ncbi:MAG: hypothetical protein HY926_08720 [Elusimicrobia bacterium]|nr:hypothetical protein [Elusimicrobiota bacterium]